MKTPIRIEDGHVLVDATTELICETHGATDAELATIVACVNGAAGIPVALASLRHLYGNLLNGEVRDTASAKRIAEGLLSPAIKALELSETPALNGESEAEAVCDEAYQVVGSLLSDLGQFDSERGQKILDNLSNARKVHDDVLPWPRLVPCMPLKDDVRRVFLSNGFTIKEGQTDLKPYVYDAAAALLANANAQIATLAGLIADLVDYAKLSTLEDDPEPACVTIAQAWLAHMADPE